jgi:hypothetical protein
MHQFMAKDRLVDHYLSPYDLAIYPYLVVGGGVPDYWRSISRRTLAIEKLTRIRKLIENIRDFDKGFAFLVPIIGRRNETL